MDTSKPKKPAHPDSDVIDRLGGTGVVAELCGVSDSAVSQWRTNGIEKGKRRLLEQLKPEAFKAEQAA